MKADRLCRRLAVLEARAEPPKFRLLWYDEEQAHLEPGTIRIQLKWLDEVRPRVATLKAEALGIRHDVEESNHPLM